MAVATEAWAADARPKADAVVTDRPGLAIGVGTADCGPILLADAEAGVIGAAHSGWRGALAGIGEATVAAMEKLGARRERIVAILGPTISQANYEVGPEVRAAFIGAGRRCRALLRPLDETGQVHVRPSRRDRGAAPRGRRDGAIAAGMHLRRPGTVLLLPPHNPPRRARLWPAAFGNRTFAVERTGGLLFDVDRRPVTLLSRLLAASLAALMAALLAACVPMERPKLGPGPPALRVSQIRELGPAPVRGDDVRFAFITVTGIPAEMRFTLEKSLKAYAATRGLNISIADDPTATYRVKGYLSAVGDRNSALLVYVWDVYDANGTAPPPRLRPGSGGGQRGRPVGGRQRQEHRRFRPRDDRQADRLDQGIAGRPDRRDLRIM